MIKHSIYMALAYCLTTIQLNAAPSASQYAPTLELSDAGARYQST